MIICRGDVGVQCQFCKHIFPSFTTYQTHLEKCQNTMRCKLCKFESNMYAELIKHKVEKHKPDPFKCQHCSMEFISQVALYDHEKEHRKKKIKV